MEHKLIEAIYSVTIDPENYSDLLTIWEDEFVENATAPKVGEFAENHCNRAFAILEMVGTVSRVSNLEQTIENHPLPTFILSENKQISFANQMAKNLYTIHNNDHSIEDLQFTPEQLKKINDFQAKLEYSDNEIFFATSQNLNEQETPILLALSKVTDDQTKVSYLQISAINTIWNDAIGEKIGLILELTAAELDLAKRLISGASLNDIAQAKSRSVETIRSQIKSLFRKTKTKTQSEVIKLFVALLNFNAQNSGFADSHNNHAQHFNSLMKQNNQLLRDKGRKLYYEIHGDPEGEPVLFMHGLISGTKFPKAAIQFFCKNNIKIIAPHRASFGYSDAVSKDQLSEHFVDDIMAVLDAENVEKFKILAQHSGSYYAYKIANILAERVIKVRIINGDVPIASFKQIGTMAGVQKILVYTAKYTPKLLPFLIKGSNAQIEKRGVEGLVEDILNSSPPDTHLINNSEIMSVIINGFKASIANGTEFLVNDIGLLCGKDWQHLMASVTCPVELYHSADTSVMPLKHVQEFTKRHQHLELNIIDHGGQYILYELPEKLLQGI